MSMHEKLVELINQNVEGAEAVANIAEVGDSSITVNTEKIVDVCRFLKNQDGCEFNVLQVITGTDYPDHIEVSYVLASYIDNLELILKVKAEKSEGDELPKVKSIHSLWKAADWQERECYDMVGVDFVGHPDLRRILTSDDWEGYPLRKDYKAAEQYRGMVIYPPEKQNLDDQNFAAVQKEKEKAERAKAAAAKKAESEGESQ